jgi:hypothetical protein
MLNVVMVSVVMLYVIMLYVVMPSVVLKSVAMLSVVIVSVVLLSVILLSVIMLSIVLLSVKILNVIMLSIVASLYQASLFSPVYHLWAGRSLHTGSSHLPTSIYSKLKRLFSEKRFSLFKLEMKRKKVFFVSVETCSMSGLVSVATMMVPAPLSPVKLESQRDS